MPSSQSQAKDLVDLLAKADPPVLTEVWDAKTAEVIIL
jgi:2-methylisocitrate lyase-like PEP mutase family enzyme